ncbi:MAG TPA: hypothetical protein DEP35_19480 [Deltaproteobacteria bacterium]|jgi:hypothetical protein|nr:hypothetical protein [Deltaproteobacteria bacterium]
MAQKKTDKSIESFEKFQKLSTLALDEGAEPEEARNAAVKAVEMLSDESGDLIVLPRAQVEALRKKHVEGQDLVKKAKEAKNEGLMLGALGGFMLAKSGMLK